MKSKELNSQLLFPRRAKKNKAQSRYRQALFMNFLSAIGFYLATFFVHIGFHQEGQDIRPREITQTFIYFSPVLYIFFRQILGLFVFTPFFFRELRFSELYKPPLWVLIRALSNFAALFAFYKSVSLGGAAPANILNTTYPFFAFIFASLFLREKPNFRKLMILGLYLYGISLLLPQNRASLWSLSEASLWGLASGVLAGLSIASLREAARKTSPSVILFWLFLLGSLLSFPLCYKELALLSIENSALILLSAFCGVGAQWLLTLSYSTLEALTGSLVSTVRIPIALFMGLLFLGESFLWNEYLGAVIIFICNILSALYLQARTQLKERAR